MFRFTGHFLWSRLDRARSREDGMAIPTVLMITVIAFGLAAVAAVGTISAQNGSTRDIRSKNALAAADAGAELAMQRQNKVKTAAAMPCVVLSSGTLAAGILPSGQTWCTGITGSVGSSTYTYYVKPPTGGAGPALIVSVGSSGGVTRRIMVSATGTAGSSSTGMPLGPEKVVGMDRLTMSGNSQINGGAGSNGTVTIKGSSEVCGSLRYGPGTPSPVGGISWDPNNPYTNGQGGGVCPGSQVGPGLKDYPPPVLPAGLTPATSATSRFFSQDGNDMPSWYLNRQTTQTPPPWDVSTRTLHLDASVTLKLKSTQPYLLCRLWLGAGATILADTPVGQPVRIFLDKPENCPSLPNVSGSPAYPAPNWTSGTKEQLRIDGGTQFLSTNSNVTGIYLLGSSTIPTAAVLAAGAQADQMVVYGPRTGIEVSGNFQLNGALIGKTMNLSGSSTVNAGFDGTQYQIPVPGAATSSTFIQTRFVECPTATITTDPSVGC